MIGFQLSYNDGGCHFSRLLSSNNLMLGVIFASVVTQVTPASGMLQAFGQGRRAHTDCQAFPRFSRRDSTVERAQRFAGTWKYALCGIRTLNYLYFHILS
jgi:hypothetical protein